MTATNHDLATVAARRGTRATLLAYNTVERLLRGDFFHYVSLGDVLADLSGYPSHWPLAGVGTTNWYRRNGELMLEGDVSAPAFLWADPGGAVPATVLDLVHDRPDAGDQPLVSPAVGGDETEPQLPFVGIAVCDPATVRSWTAASGDDVHDWVRVRCEEENIGLAGVRVTGPFAAVDYQAICHIPIGGVGAGAGTTAAADFRFGRADGERWRTTGLFAANPTLQNVVSGPGQPLHLHGYSVETRRGGHVRAAEAAGGVTVEVWPLKDLLVRIHDLDTAWLPVRDLA